VNSATGFDDLPTFETGRLLLRKVTLDNAANIFEYASDPEVPNEDILDSQERVE
jgi:RimJ/RimL family protein N-acetyltransferase